jgi:hypothetical protein
MEGIKEGEKKNRCRESVKAVATKNTTVPLLDRGRKSKLYINKSILFVGCCEDI